MVLTGIREDGPIRILLVESNIEDATEMHSTLMGRDAAWYDLTEVSRLGAAIEALANGSFEVILLAVELPDATGVEAVRQLLPASQGVPIITIGRIDTTIVCARTLQAGAHDYVIKGHVSNSTLKRTIYTAIDRHQGMTQWDESDRNRQLTIEKQASIDPLTGLFNRRQIRARLLQEMFRCERAGSSLTVLLLSIDSFGELRTARGEAVADQVIATCGAILKHRIRVTDLIGRYDEELFCFIFPDTDIEGADVISNRLRVRIEREPHKDAEGNEFHVTVSGGIAAYEKSIIDTVVLIKRANRALEAAQTSSGNKVVSYTLP